MLHFAIDPHSGVPVYRQLMDQVKYYIAAGTLPAGAQLPSIRELAHALVINPTTVVKAFAELERDGVLEIKQGRGAFVGTKATAMSDRERDKALRRLARQLVVEAAQMGVTLETALQAVQREWAPLRGGSGEPDASQPSEPEGQGKLPE